MISLGIDPCRIIPSALYIVGLMWICHPVSAQRDKTHNCGACMAIVDEVTWEISQIDPKKTIQVGSFRIDSHGNQNLKEVPLATSESHLTELLENICENMKDYARSVDDVTGLTSYLRLSSRAGKAVSISGNIQIDSDGQKSLKFACEGLLEEYDEEIIGLLRKSVTDDLVTKICVDLTHVCIAENITAQIAAADASSSADAVDSEAGKEDDSDAEGDDDGETAEDEMDSATEDEFMQKINSVSASESDVRTDSVDKEEL